VVLAAIWLLTFDRIYWSINNSAPVYGIFDECAHLGTGFLVLGAFFRGARPSFAWAVMVCSCILDLDHIPQYFGDYFLTHHTGRPYTHSWVTPTACLLIALLWPRARYVMLGAAVGFVFHLMRDMAERPYSGVSLFWPFDDHSYTYPQNVYLVIMAAIAVIALIRALLSRAGPRAVRGAPRSAAQAP
jgi:hypothetical protein